ncbi:hypothetical protein [Actinoplanes solisilvae]|uniref:hypothetical protein n=1 Tax=Actinoplanes solisilvae TaxID=2486853 RepID=UPI0013E2F868|nr:hypothetical protein [Actinoplanes solisilvae]
MSRRGHSTAIGKFAKIHQDRRVSEIRRLGVAIREEQRAADSMNDRKPDSSSH